MDLCKVGVHKYNAGLKYCVKCHKISKSIFNIDYCKLGMHKYRPMTYLNGDEYVTIKYCIKCMKVN